ncbi:MAG: type II toxin-antitoxin system VapC family toxin [Thermomicrobiales bacterium]
MSVSGPGRSPIVFVDTSAFLGMASRRDKHHQRAKTVQAQSVAERWQFVSTNFIIAETHALALRRHDPRLALALVEDLLSAATVIVRVNEEDERRALEILRRYDDKRFSYTDATSFAVMERLAIGQAFTFDRHFAQYGFQVVGLGA